MQVVGECTQEHDGGSAGACVPAFAHVRALRLLADCVQVE